MSASSQSIPGQPLRLLPHQTAFVEEVFRPGGKKVLALRAMAGSGKSVAVAAVIQRQFGEQPQSRVLLLSPAALTRQFVATLEQTKVPVLLVDRYRYRELRNDVAHGQIWAQGLVAVLSLDFARQPDVLTSLAMTHWDLVVIDGFEGLGDVRREAVTTIGAVARKVIVMTTTPRAPLDVFPTNDTSIIEWRRGDLLDESGRALAGPRPTLEQATYVLTKAELGVAASVEGFCFAIGAAAPAAGSIVVESLRRRLHSSPAALEAELRALATEATAADSLALSDNGDTDRMPDDSPALDNKSAVVTGVVNLAIRVLEEVDRLEFDSKATRLGELITEIRRTSAAPERICILTRYPATLFYLSATLEDAQRPVLVLHENDTVDERGRTLEAFAKQAGLLLTTQSVMQGFDPPATSDLVFYDLPDSTEMATALVGWFDRLGRQIALRVHVLVAENLEHAMVSSGLEQLRAAIGGAKLPELEGKG